MKTVLKLFEPTFARVPVLQLAIPKLSANLRDMPDVRILGTLTS